MNANQGGRTALPIRNNLSLVYAGSMIVFLLLQPFLAAAPFAAADVIVVFAMGLICFISFALFAYRVA